MPLPSIFSFLCVPSKLLENHVFCFLLLGRGTAKVNYTKFLRIISSEALAYFKSYLQMNIRIDFASIRLRYEKKRFWGPRVKLSQVSSNHTIYMIMFSVHLGDWSGFNSMEELRKRCEGSSYPCLLPWGLQSCFSKIILRNRLESRTICLNFSVVDHSGNLILLSNSFRKIPFDIQLVWTRYFYSTLMSYRKSINLKFCCTGKQIPKGFIFFKSLTFLRVLLFLSCGF